MQLGRTCRALLFKLGIPAIGAGKPVDLRFFLFLPEGGVASWVTFLDQIANSVRQLLPDHLKSENFRKSKAFGLRGSSEMARIQIVLDTSGHFATENVSQICEIC